MVPNYLEDDVWTYTAGTLDDFEDYQPGDDIRDVVDSGWYPESAIGGGSSTETESLSIPAYVINENGSCKIGSGLNQTKKDFAGTGAPISDGAIISMLFRPEAVPVEHWISIRSYANAAESWFKTRLYMLTGPDDSTIDVYTGGLDEWTPTGLSGFTYQGDWGTHIWKYELELDFTHQQVMLYYTDVTDNGGRNFGGSWDWVDMGTAADMLAHGGLEIYVPTGSSSITYDEITVTVPITYSTCVEARYAGYGVATDLNEDCHVDLADMALFMADYLGCNDPVNPDCSY